MLVEEIRKIFCYQDSPNAKDVIYRTSIVPVFSQILIEQPAGGGKGTLIATCTKIEALWTLINLAYTEEQSTMMLLQSESLRSSSEAM